MIAGCDNSNQTISFLSVSCLPEIKHGVLENPSFSSMIFQQETFIHRDFHTPHFITGGYIVSLVSYLIHYISDQYNVNPGLINPVYGCLIGRLPFMYHIVTIWRVPPLINKPWFGIIRG